MNTNNTNNKERVKCEGACAGCDLTTDHCEHCCGGKGYVMKPLNTDKKLADYICKCCGKRVITMERADGSQYCITKPNYTTTKKLFTIEEVERIFVPMLDEGGGNRNKPKVSVQFVKGFNCAIRMMREQRARLEEIK